MPEIKTLPDYLDHNLKIISIGLNPSLPSVKAGFYFANPRNRFWKALNGSRLVSEELQPGEEAMRILFRKYKIGFTDLVKRPTRTGHQLRAEDYREGAPVLKEKLLRYQPELAWFHGTQTYQAYLKYAEGLEAEVPWGKQKHLIGKTRVYVTPNPSPANAKYSIDDLVRFYNAMVSYRIQELFGVGTG
jgi:TDG/mug DNA glycosylase family protein